MGRTSIAANLATVLAAIARHRPPAVYANPAFAAAGGIVALGVDPDAGVDGAGGYVGRILNGTKVANLPVQAPSKYILTVNLNAAKALGMSIPTTILIRADEVIG